MCSPCDSMQLCIGLHLTATTCRMYVLQVLQAALCIGDVPCLDAADKGGKVPKSNRHAAGAVCRSQHQLSAVQPEIVRTWPRSSTSMPTHVRASSSSSSSHSHCRRSKLKQQCRKSYAGLVRCLQNNSNDFSKCQTEFLPFDQCTEDFSPGVDGL